MSLRTYLAHGDEGLVSFVALVERARNGLVVYDLSVSGWLANGKCQQTNFISHGTKAQWFTYSSLLAGVLACAWGLGHSGRSRLALGGSSSLGGLFG